MKRNPPIKILTLALALGVGACQVPEPSPITMNEPPPLDRSALTRAEPADPQAFVRIHPATSKLSTLPVTVNLRQATLMESLTRVDAQLNVVPTSTDIDFQRKYDVRVHDLSLQQYLGVLEGLTGYALTLHPTEPIIEVSSHLTRSWDVSTFASHGQSLLQVGQAVTLDFGGDGGGEEGGDNNPTSSNASAVVTFDHRDSPWDNLLANARAILMPDAAGAAESDLKASAHTWLTADRRLGLLRARGPATHIERLDAWLNEQIRRGSRQVLLAVAILDVTRSEGLSSGLDLGLVYERLDERIRWSRQTPSALSFSALPNGWEIDAALDFGRWTLDAMIQQLSLQNQVAVRSDPIFTVINGMTSYLGDGEEISFISGTSLLPGEDGRTPLLSTEFEHIRVGFRIAVTPRIRNDGSILVEVVPVLSSIRSQSEFNTGIDTIVRPNIAIQEMATTAITRSGKPILLGGLIQSQSLENAHGLPCDHFLCDLFSSSTFENRNRELMIVITPIEVVV